MPSEPFEDVLLSCDVIDAVSFASTAVADGLWGAAGRMVDESMLL